MPTMVDSCVILDVFTQDPEWFEWSAASLANAAEDGALIINPVIYAEVSVRFSTLERLNERLPSPPFEYHAIPHEAAFLAGKCFRDYRRSGGHRQSPLPDFFIGAHAAVAGLPLLTRDPKRFRYHFPSLKLVCP